MVDALSETILVTGPVVTGLPLDRDGSDESVPWKSASEQSMSQDLRLDIFIF